MSNGADQNGKAGGWRWGNIAAVVGVLGLGGWLIWSQTDLSLADFCTLLTYVGHKDQVAACAASNGGFYLGAGFLLILMGLGWLVLTKYKAASEGFALMASHILGFVKYSTPEEPSPAPIAADRESDLKFLKELADEVSLSPEQAEHFQQLKSALADQALTRLRAEAGPSESEADAQADTAMAEAVEEAVDQGSDAQIAAMRFIGAGDIPTGLDRLAAAAEIASANAAALWRQIGEIAYSVDTLRARNAYERVIALGTVAPWDFIFLARLQVNAGSLSRSVEIATAGLALTSLAVRDKSILLDELGDVLVAKGDLDGAFEHFRESLEIAQALARDDPGNAGWRRDLAFSNANIALAGGDPRAHWGEAVAILEALATEGKLAPRDHGSLETARAQLATLVDGPGDGGD